MTQPYQQQIPQQPAQFQPQIIVQQTGNNLSPTVTIGDWFVFMILQFIPGLNFIMLIVYACDSTKPSRANFAKLQLIFMIISTIIAIIAVILFCGGIVSMSSIMDKQNLFQQP